MRAKDELLKEFDSKELERVDDVGLFHKSDQLRLEVLIDIRDILEKELKRIDTT
ncbi:unnamed protein product, partial [marine sediment metagenome]